MKIDRKTLTRLLGLLCAVAASTADAALVRIDFTGTNSSPAATNPWGTPVTDLAGYIVYDDATSPSGTTGPTATNYSGAIRELQFSIGSSGSTVFSGSLSGGSYGSAQVRDAAGSDILSFNNLVLGASQVQGEVLTITNGTATRTFNSAQPTLSLSGSPATFTGQALAGVDATGLNTQRQLQLFLSYTQQPGTVDGAWPAANFNYNLQPVSVSAVPLPAAAWLLGSGLFSLGAAGLRRRRAARAA